MKATANQLFLESFVAALLIVQEFQQKEDCFRFFDFQAKSLVNQGNGSNFRVLDNEENMRC
jgi:hypothetical protein